MFADSVEIGGILCVGFECTLIRLLGGCFRVGFFGAYLCVWSVRCGFVALDCLLGDWFLGFAFWLRYMFGL